MKIASTKQLKTMDEVAIKKFEVPGLLLMESSAFSVVQVLRDRFSPLRQKRVIVVCGPGNNGGDGLAIARLLKVHEHVAVSVLLSHPHHQYKAEALVNFNWAKSCQIQIIEIKDFEINDFDLIIDAIFGIGFKGKVDEEIGQLIQKLNLSEKPMLSVDVPSGLNSDSGEIDGCVIKANITVTSSFAKYGQLVYPGLDHVGDLIIRDIGIPEAVINESTINTFATTPEDIAAWLPTRKNNRDANKGSFGHVLIFAGSPRFVGAAVLVSEAAARSGAGLVTLAVPEDLIQEVVARVSAVVMTHALANSKDPEYCTKSLKIALSLLENASVVAIGPGVGQSETTSEFVKAIISSCPHLMVIDADALNILAKETDCGKALIRRRKAGTVLTPHPGEMARLLKIETVDVQADRRLTLQRAVEGYTCTVLLKGARTLISDSSGKLYLNTSGNPGMATGGVGDALTGVVASLLAQGLDPLPAAAAGAYIHGLAGDLVAAEHGGEIGLIATDLIFKLPEAIAKLQKMPIKV